MRTCLCILLMLATMTVAAAPSPARLFLYTADSGVLPEDVRDVPFPMLIVGADAESVRGNAPGGRVKAFAAGERILLPPKAVNFVTFALVSPKLSTGEFFEPVSLHRSGNELVLRVEHWTDDRPRLQNIRRRRAQFMHVHLPEPGKYALRLEVLHLFNASANGNTLYAPKGMRAASVDFTVAGLNAPADDAAASVDEGGLKAEALPAAPLPVAPRLHVAPTVETLDARDGHDVALGAGTFDLRGWAVAPKPLRPPTLGPPTAAGPIYVTIQSATLNSGEFLTLGPVVWQDKNTCTITADLWTDSGERRKNLVHSDLIVVPLDPPARVNNAWPAGTYTVYLQLNRLNAPRPNGAYAPGITDQLAKPVPPKVTFTLK
jgi:hypothetical protein